MPGPVFLEGEAVTLHPVEDDDLDFLQACVNHPRVRQGIASVTPLNHQQEEQWLENVADDEVHFLVCADDERVGVVGLADINEVFGTVEVGYYLHPDAWGNGYATDAVRRAVDYAFAERRLHKVSAKCYAHNEASQGVLLNVGFEREGVLREEAFVDGERVDLYYYGLLADEWDRPKERGH